ncbi:MAG: hypothetical protein M1832_001964 [Thelocarpon impressellum]|nr:MAG: hypothetical protein M1832_001964 [Thelocarpon impressellum]
MRPTLPLRLPRSLPPSHHDLPTFLAHATRTALSRSSTLYAGTHYEYTVARALRRYGFLLARTGGRADGGVDLRGSWTLPLRFPPEGAARDGGLRLRALVQCKAHTTRAPAPAAVRELEGAFAALPASFLTSPSTADATGVLAVLAAPLPATPGVREALRRSRAPLAFFMVGIEGGVQQCLWNGRAGEMGLEGVGVTVRYETAKGDGEVGREIALTWRGEVLPLLEDEEN